MIKSMPKPDCLRFNYKQFSSFCQMNSWCSNKSHDPSRYRFFRGYIPNHNILHLGTNNLEINDTFRKNIDKILNLATSVKTKEYQFLVSSLVKRNDKSNNKSNEVNQLLRSKCGSRKLSFIDHKNINRNMLDKI